MRRFIPSSVLAGIVVVGCAGLSSSVWAQDNTAAVSEANAVSINKGGLKDESIGLKPEVGVLNFNDATGNKTSRGAVGLAFDMNFSKILSGVAQNIYFGISTGGLYSHVGGTGSNFFGSSPTANGSGTGGANVALFPANLKLGYNFTDKFRVSGHGGGNVIYSSVANAITTGDNSRNWNIYPNAGADVDIGLGKSVALTLRPDWTFTPNVGFFTGTLEFGFALG